MDERPKRVYLTGPMRGYPRWNVAAFDEAAARWKALGCEVVNPCELWPGLDLHTALPEQLEELAKDPVWLREVILYDCRQVASVDALVLLPGWQTSHGAAVEVALALFLGLSMYDAATTCRVQPRPKPWLLQTHGIGVDIWGAPASGLPIPKLNPEYFNFDTREESK